MKIKNNMGYKVEITDKQLKVLQSRFSLESIKKFTYEQACHELKRILNSNCNDDWGDYEYELEMMQYLPDGNGGW